MRCLKRLGLASVFEVGTYGFSLSDVSPLGEVSLFEKSFQSLALPGLEGILHILVDTSDKSAILPG